MKLVPGESRKQISELSDDSMKKLVMPSFIHATKIEKKERKEEPRSENSESELIKKTRQIVDFSFSLYSL